MINIELTELEAEYLKDFLEVNLDQPLSKFSIKIIGSIITKLKANKQ